MSNFLLPFEKGSTLKGKNLLLSEKTFLFRCGLVYRNTIGNCCLPCQNW